MRWPLVLCCAILTPAAGHAQTAAPDPVPPHDSFTVASHAVGEERRINVYTPPEYASSPRRRFPVLYMPDGGLEEDFPHLVNTVDSLLRLGRIRPFIVVGIENTERRRDTTGPTRVGSDSAIAKHVGGSAAFREFIRDELMPEVRRRYRTTGETGIVGESLVGLFIAETFLLEPKLFDNYIVISPSLWWNNDELLRTAPGQLRNLEGLKRALFLTAANEPGIAAQADTLAQAIRAAQPAGLTFHFVPRPDLEHSTIYRGMAAQALLQLYARR